MRVALAGNPNSGKTTLFNQLTGSNQHVGNFPGVTVEKKVGTLKSDKSVEVVDLPGIYSLSPYSLEEVVARNYLAQEHPDVILNIVDGTNLERNLYLTTQLAELGIPMLVAVNMADILTKQGETINAAALESALGVTVVQISALKGEGLTDLIAALPQVAAGASPRPLCFTPDIEPQVAEVTAKLLASVDEHLRRFYAVKLLEGDQRIGEDVEGLPDVTANKEAIEAACDDTSESAIINERYNYLTRIMPSITSKDSTKVKESISDRIDRIVTNRILALPIFIVTMMLVYFVSVSSVGAVATDWANDGVFGDGWYLDASPIVGLDGAQADFDEAQGAYDDAVAALGAGIGGSYEAYDDETGENSVVEVDQALYDESVAVVAAYGETSDSYGEAGPDPADFGIWVPGIPPLLDTLLLEDGANLDPDGWLYGLIMDGIVAGVGAMLGFLPQMFILFLMLAFLELCGYTSRVAFILDRIFRRFGLSGKSFIPMLISSGCGVPGVMASRTIDNEHDRRMTVMTTTFIPCGAKLPFIALIASAIFGGVWWVAPSAYFLGIAAVLISGIILKKTRFFAGDTTPFVMELPAYHLPSVGSILRSAGERCLAFAKKAVTVLLLAAILIWFLSTYGIGASGLVAVENSDESLLAALGGAIAWLFAPLGWGTWEATAASISGLMAKEQIVSTMAILYDSPDGWFSAVQGAFGLAAGYSFLAFNLLCVPCFAAMSAIWREMGSVKWAAAAWGYECLTAWMVALWVYQLVGLALGECVFGLWTIVAIASLGAVIYLLVRPNKHKQAASR